MLKRALNQTVIRTTRTNGMGSNPLDAQAGIESVLSRSAAVLSRAAIHSMLKRALNRSRPRCRWPAPQAAIHSMLKRALNLDVPDDLAGRCVLQSTRCSSGH